MKKYLLGLGCALGICLIIVHGAGKTEIVYSNPNGAVAGLAVALSTKQDSNLTLDYIVAQHTLVTNGNLLICAQYDPTTTWQRTNVNLTTLGTSAVAARGYLELPETATNSVLPIANGGTGQTSADLARPALGIRAGTLTTSADGTYTNNFVGSFAGPPFIIISQIGNAVTTTNLLATVTASNFVFSAGAPSISANWVAVGTP
jgi:hypothetical protein